MNKFFKIAAIVLAVTTIGAVAIGVLEYRELQAKTSQIDQLQRMLEVLKGNVQTKEKLETLVEEQNKKIAFYQKENSMQEKIVNFGLDFSDAYLSGNLDRVDPMLADKVVVVKDGKSIYLVRNGDLKNKSLLFDTSEGKVVKEFRLSKYEKIDDTTYFLEIKQYFTDSNGNDMKSPTILDITVVEDGSSVKLTNAKVNTSAN